ncbi:two-component sensor histidine kinase [Streptomyces fumigatiscleroticus]|nr:two-component sensor histidine kinase [Streptomyces fumigatiscleroticus]
MNRTAHALRAFRHLAPRTLRGRLSLVALTTAALLMTILTVMFNAVMNMHLRHQADDELRNRAAAVATTVDTSGPRVHVLETANDGLLDADVWIYAGTRLLEKPPSASGGGPLTRAAGRLAGQHKQGCATAQVHHHQPVRLCSHPVPGRHATAATVVTTLDLAPYRNSADTLLLGALTLDAVMLVSTYLLTRLAVGRALRPVRTMTDQAAQWSAVSSEERFGMEDHPVELARLGASLDALLDRIRTVLRHEQQLTGELSHELRTPLTRIVMECDWWRARPRTDVETRTTQEVIAESAQSMLTICDTLLNDARDNALGAAAVPGTTDVVPVLHHLLQRLNSSDRTMLEMKTQAPVLRAAVARAVLERILSPLLANAVRYAHSRVTVSARRIADAVLIAVVDDGDGVPEAFVHELFQPGRRADPGDGHDGAGLGLPLARRLARAVDGEVSYDPAHAPGARFTVRLPAG